MHDLEQEILSCWIIVDDINLLYENVVEAKYTNDEITNVLLGMKELYNMRFASMFRKYEQTLKRKNNPTDGEIVSSMEAKWQKDNKAYQKLVPPPGIIK